MPERDEYMPGLMPERDGYIPASPVTAANAAAVPG
jgi:hypothetical protein